MTFVCGDCANRDHEACRGGTWCDCRHRAPDPAGGSR